jgi:hypothetical protein
LPTPTPPAEVAPESISEPIEEVKVEEILDDENDYPFAEVQDSTSKSLLYKHQE